MIVVGIALLYLYENRSEIIGVSNNPEHRMRKARALVACKDVPTTKNCRKKNPENEKNTKGK